MNDAAPAIPGYALTGLIGQGRAGTVWKATEEATGRIVALKVVPITDSVDAARFQRESRALEGLDHPHVVGRLASGRQGDALWLALEFMPDDVRRLLRRGLPPERTGLAIARDAADGLAGLAGAGLVHRDISPSNILLGEDGSAKLGDLGLVRVDGTASLTRSGEVLGTPAYMSPEQARGEAVDERSDIYALGATLYELITGRPPYSGATPWAVVRQVATAPAPDPREILPTITAQGRAIIRCAMARDPSERYANAAQLREDLEAVLADGVPSHAGRRRKAAAAMAAPSAPPTARIDAKPIALAAGLIAVAALLGVFIGSMLASSRSTDAVTADSARIAATAEAWNAYLTAHPSGAAADEARAMLALHQRLAASATPAVDALDLRHQAERLRADAARVVQEIADTRAQIEKIRTAPATPIPVPVATVAPVAPVVAEAPHATIPKAPVPDARVTTVRDLPATSTAATTVIATTDAFEALAVGESTAAMIASRSTVTSLGRAVDLHGLSCDPRHPLVAYAWNSNSSLWRTKDAGRTWTLIGANIPTPSPTRIACWSDDGGSFFIPSYFSSDHIGTVYTNDGITRAQVPAPPAADKTKVYLGYDRVMMPDGSFVCWQTTGSGADASSILYRSRDGGAKWQACGPPIRNLWSMHRSDVGVIIACMSANNGRRCSVDLGTTWVDSPAPMVGGGSSSGSPWCAASDRILVANSDNIEEYALDGRVLPSTKLSAETLKISNGIGGVQAIAVDPLDHDVWYIAAVGLGLLRSVDHGQTWSGYPLVIRAHTSKRVSLGFTSGPKPHLLVGIADAILSIDDDGHPAELFPLAPLAVAKPGRTSDPEDLPVAAPTAAAIAKRVVRSMVGTSASICGISCHPKDPMVALTWNERSGIWRTDDGGATWTKIAQNRGDYDNTMVSACWSADAKLVFIPSVGDSVGRLLSDGFKTLETVAGPWPARKPGDKAQARHVYQRAMAPNGDLFCSWTASQDFSGPYTLCRSTDRGKSWKTIGNPIPRMWGLFRSSKGILLQRFTETSDGYEFSGDLGATWKFCAPASGNTGGRNGLPTWTLADRLLLAGGAEVMEIGLDGKQLATTQIPGEFKEVSNLYYFEGFAVDPRNPAVWYVSGRELGLLRSTDHGKHWFGYPLIVHQSGNQRMTLSVTAGPKPRLMVTLSDSVLIIDDEGWPAELFPIPFTDVMKQVRDGSKP